MRPLVPHPRSNAPRFSKQRRPWLEPIASPKEAPRFIPPPFTNNTNLRLPLRVIVPDAADAADSAGKLVFHAVGDTGGIHGDEAEIAVAEAMEAQVKGADGADRPAFFYHLGDVIYYNGQSEYYTSQFYEPYKYYPGPIMGIPGNHDGDTSVQRGDPADTEPTLYGFMQNFCDSQARHLYSPYRATMTQPYVYWTLDAPLVTIVGLYSNVEGSLDARGGYEQQRFLEDQLTQAPTDRFLIVAVHHPPYSLDASHGGSPDIVSALDHAFATSKRVPHVVLSGHVHDYQRFTREFSRRQIPYIAAGNGGYANIPARMHRLQKDENGNYPQAGMATESEVDPELKLTLESCDQTNPGFLRVTVTREQLSIEAFAVPFDASFQDAPFDSVSVDLSGNIVSSTRPGGSHSSGHRSGHSGAGGTRRHRR